MNNAFAISQIGDTLYNQIKGNKLIGFLKNKELKLMEVDGSVQSIYNVIQDSILNAINVSQTSYMTMIFNNGKVDTLIMKPQSSGTIYPPTLIEDPDKFLRGYEWLSDIRPKNSMDVMRIPKNIKKEDK